MASPTLTLAIIVLLTTGGAAQPRLDGPLPDPMSDAEFATLAESFDADGSAPADVRPALRCARGRCEVSETRGTHARETLVFDGPDGAPVPAYFALPTDGAGPYPVVLLLHALNGSKDDFWSEGSPLDSLREALHASGFAVLALDAPYHGGRLYENGFNDPASLVLGGQADRLRAMSRRTVAEHRRALDYLATRADVDASRVGALGFSQGAMHALYLGALEPRLSALVVWATPMRKNDPPFYPGHFAARIAGPAVLMLAGTDDPFYTTEEAEAVFGVIPSATKRLVPFEGGHRPEPAEIPRVVAWLEAHLFRLE